MVVEGMTLVTTLIRAYISRNKQEGLKKREEYYELIKAYEDARNSYHPDFNRDDIGEAKQALKNFEKSMNLIVNKDLDEEGVEDV